MVEHSQDGIRYASTGRVTGSGSSKEEKSYTYTHKTPLYGKNYYRLRQVDFDGQYTLSPIREVTINYNEGILKIYPNPATTDNVKIDYYSAAEKETYLSLFDINGNLVQYFSINCLEGLQTFFLDFNNLTNRSY